MEASGFLHTHLPRLPSACTLCALLTHAGLTGSSLIDAPRLLHMFYSSVISLCFLSIIKYRYIPSHSNERGGQSQDKLIGD